LARHRQCALLGSVGRGRRRRDSFPCASPAAGVAVRRCGGIQRRGRFCATQSSCPHRQGPLSEGAVDRSTVTCSLHGAQSNVWTGAVLRGPANEPLKTYTVTVDGEVGRVNVPLAHAVQVA